MAGSFIVRWDIAVASEVEGLDTILYLVNDLMVEVLLVFEQV